MLQAASSLLAKILCISRVSAWGESGKEENQSAAADNDYDPDLEAVTIVEALAVLRYTTRKLLDQGDEWVVEEDAHRGASDGRRGMKKAAREGGLELKELV